MLDIICEHCGRALKIPEKYLGQRGKCNHCQGVITVTVAPKWGVRDEVLEAARANCAARGVNISDQMCAQLAEKVTKGLKLGLGVEGTARLLREGLGLDAPRGERLEKYRQSLIEKTQRDIEKKVTPRTERIDNFRKSLAGKGLSEADIDKKVASRVEQLEKYRESLVEKAQCDIEKKVAKEKQYLINERARSIAAYEMGRALEAGAYQIAQQRGDTHKACITTGEGESATYGGVCDTCLANEAVGFIPIDEAFPSGHYSSPFHEDCLCTMASLMDTGAGELERGQARASKRYAETKAARARKEA